MILDIDVIGQQTAVVENAVVNALNTKYGDLHSSVDLLMLLLPTGTLTAGTTDWKVSNFKAANIKIF